MLWKEVLKDRDVAVLVNNVGMLQSNRFMEEKPDVVYLNLCLNVVPQTMMSKYAISHFLKRTASESTPPKSAIINMSSSSAPFPVPWESIYGAVKQYNRAFSIANSKFLSGRGIASIAVMPNYVHTQMNEGYDFTYSEPEEVTGAVVRQVGYQGESYGSLWHCVQCCLIMYFPRALFHWAYLSWGRGDKDPLK